MSRKHPQFTSIEKTTAGRRFYGFVGIAAIFFGVSTIGLGRLYYHNYRGDNVFCSVRDFHRNSRANNLFSKSAKPKID